MLLEYLVRSKAQRAVLRTFASGGDGLTIREVALKAGLPYSNAHQEVGEMRRAGFLTMTRVGNAALHAWDESNPDSRLLRKLLKCRGTERDAEEGENTYWNLRRWGAPLVRRGRPGRKQSLGETLLVGGLLSRRDPHVLEVWPLVVARNRMRLDLFDLILRARRQGAGKPVGFLLALSGKLLGDPGLGEAAERLRDRRMRRSEPFSLLPEGTRSRRLASSRTPDVARAWNFTLNLSLDGLSAFLRKHL